MQIVVSRQRNWFVLHRLLVVLALAQLGWYHLCP
jgi:hypothetical protein